MCFSHGSSRTCEGGKRRFSRGPYVRAPLAENIFRLGGENIFIRRKVGNFGAGRSRWSKVSSQVAARIDWRGAIATERTPAAPRCPLTIVKSSAVVSPCSSRFQSIHFSKLLSIATTSLCIRMHARIVANLARQQDIHPRRRFCPSIVEPCGCSGGEKNLHGGRRQAWP